MSLAQHTLDPRPADNRTAETRRRIIETSLRLFAEHGFKGVSVRDISAAADVNVAAVSYHFGSKRGLYDTIFQTVLAEDEGRFEEQMSNLTTLLDRAGDDRTLLAAAVEVLAAGLVTRIAAYEHGQWFSVLLARELALPGDLFEMLYRRRAVPMLGLLARLVGAARGLPATSQSVRLTANLVHGQVLNLVFARPILWRQLGWDGGYTPERVAVLARSLADLIGRAVGLDPPGSKGSLLIEEGASR
jgi:TetR/AcrR family transcriptional regulator, regulator of cefoperazone and chloramphenicol sensitivity